MDRVPDGYLLTPEEDVRRWLEKNGVSREQVMLQPDVVLAVPAVFNALAASARRWGARVETLRVAWEPGMDAGVVRAVNISLEDASFSVYRTLTSAPMAVGQLERLIAVGAQKLFYAGYAEAISTDTVPGDLILAPYAVADDGMSWHYTDQTRPAADAGLLSRISQAAETLGISIKTAPAWTHDAVYRRAVSRSEELRHEGVKAVDTVVAPLYAVAALRQVPLAAVLVVDGEAQDEVERGTEDVCRLVVAAQGLGVGG